LRTWENFENMGIEKNFENLRTWENFENMGIEKNFENFEKKNRKF